MLRWAYEVPVQQQASGQSTTWRTRFFAVSICRCQTGDAGRASAHETRVGVAVRPLLVVLVLLPLVSWMWIVVMARDIYGPMTGASAWMMTAIWDVQHLLLLCHVRSHDGGDDAAVCRTHAAAVRRRRTTIPARNGSPPYLRARGRVSHALDRIRSIVTGSFTWSRRARAICHLVAAARLKRTLQQ
jgi:hypothetical protein